MPARLLPAPARVSRLRQIGRDRSRRHNAIAALRRHAGGDASSARSSGKWSSARRTSISTRVLGLRITSGSARRPRSSRTANVLPDSSPVGTNQH